MSTPKKPITVDEWLDSIPSPQLQQRIDRTIADFIWPREKPQPLQKAVAGVRS